MPRTARASQADLCYHVLTRGNARQIVFHDERDYDAFTALLVRAAAERPMRLLAYCLMPNHLHFVVQPYGDGDLGVWMHWLLTTHVRYHQHRHATIGRVWQGRYKAFPIQRDVHLLTVVRYVERNPVRAGLVRDCIQWRWSSAARRDPQTGRPTRIGDLLAESPVPLPQTWTDWVDEPLTACELESVRLCAQRERPYGQLAWVHGTAQRLGLQSSLNPRGRPVSKVR